MSDGTVGSHKAVMEWERCPPLQWRRFWEGTVPLPQEIFGHIGRNWYILCTAGIFCRMRKAIIIEKQFNLTCG